jgi:methionyl aminopeptidase
MTITIHKSEDFEKMRIAGKLAGEILDYITPFVEVGVTTNYLNDLCHNKIIENNAIPAPLGYHPRGFKYPFPKSICTSVNEIICHGVPSNRILKNGDIVNIDVTVIVDGWHGDSSRMYFVGDKVSIKAKKLTQVTYDCMMFGIQQVKPGVKIGNIGYAIQEHADKNGFSVVRDYCGHGIGKVFHAEPSVLHYGKKNEGIVLQEGMFFTVEPMINEGSHYSKKDEILKNDPVLYEWTVITADKNNSTGKRSLSAQFEHTIGVTKDGFEIFTASPRGLDFPPYKLG